MLSEKFNCLSSPKMAINHLQQESPEILTRRTTSRILQENYKTKFEHTVSKS